MADNDQSLQRLNAIQNHLTQATGPADLARERANASFDVKHMQWFYFGGREMAEAMELSYQIIRRDPYIYVDPGQSFDLTRSQKREITMRQLRRFNEIVKSLKNPKLAKAFKLAIAFYSETLAMKLYVHETLFIEAFELHGTIEQWEQWQNPIREYKVIGCFAMTELGHSSFLRGLETTATYDRATDEFILHSPNLTATKWLIGMAGQTATHTVAICKTIIDGKIFGIDWFVVQLRDLKTGRLMPGVTVGDVGAKYGRNGLDNGWIQFSHVRIPRTNMLMKWSKVSREGKYQTSPDSTLSYANLIGERFTVLTGTQTALCAALTIACRYGCVRRQGPNDEQIMDYQNHHVKLMPGVATIYILNVVERVIMKRWQDTLVLAKTNQAEFLKRLPDMHALSAGLKAAITWWGSDVLERCRRALGGHGYLSYNAIPDIIGDWGVTTTGGGDNVVLLQQTARYLLKVVLQGKDFIGSTEYLNNIKVLLKKSQSNLSNDGQLLDLKFVLDAYTWLVAKQLQTLSTTLQTAEVDAATAWNDNQVALVKLAELHSFRFLLCEYVCAIEALSLEEFSDLVPILRKMGQLWALHIIHNSLDLFLETGYFSPDQAQMTRKAYLNLCKDTRREVIPLVDAWGIPDFVLRAPLGKYDGDIYPAYFQTVRAAPECVGVPSWWNTEVKPLTDP